MPPLPSPPATTSIRSPASTRATHGQRGSVPVAQSRTSTPKHTTNTAGSGGIRSAKVRGSSDKENGSDAGHVRPARRRSSVLAMREKLPSKDGTAQRHAKEVEGLKDYQLGQCLGRGAFGSVYAALNWSTGETVAIKQIRLSDMPKTELNVIMQEIDLLKNLHHPNIVKYHGFVKSADSLYIILEYCEQGSLHSICKNFGKFPENLVALYTAQTLQGLLFLHEQGVIHRDIKGANILTTKDGLIKLADFGVATKAQGITEGSVVGTPYWMAPEVIELAGATTASDIWSLGCTVIELLDGRPPYHQFAPMPALFRIVNDDHPPLPEGASPLVRDFLMQCFQKDPNLRVSAKKLLKHPWIVSAKRGNTSKPTEYDEAIKSVQEWNEALKASPPPADKANGRRRPSTKLGSRPVSRSSALGATTASKAKADQTSKPAFKLNTRKSQTAEAFQSPINDEGRDNWDQDFESLRMGLSGLHIPDRLKQQNGLDGLFSAQKLKQYANFDVIPEMDGKVEEWDEEFEGDLTVRSPMHLAQGDALETVRPFYPPRTSNDDIKHKPPQASSHSKRSGSTDQHSRKASKDSQPRTQILKPVHKQSAIPKRKPTPPHPLKKAPSTSSNKERFREEDEEDYSDLVAEDEDAFLKKLAGFSPNRPVNPKDLFGLQTKLGGSMRRRRTHTPTQLVHDAAAMKRTRSSLEIQKYAEDDNDEDFTELVFDEEPIQVQTGTTKSRSPKSAISGGSETASERGTLKLTSFMSWGDEEDEDDDPFAALEEELDEVDLESNVARDKHARLCSVVEGLVSDMKLGQPEEVLAEIIDHLLQILWESPDVKSVIVSSHGMLPILEILETSTRPHIILRLLKIVNCILSDNIEVQENLCFVGGIPIITRFAHKKYSSEIRLEAAAFVRTMYQTPTLTLQMFVSCGGLNVLVEFLEEDYDVEAGRELVLVGVNGIWSVFEMQGPTPKNDFCRIFSRSSVLYPLSLVLNRVLDEDGELAEVIEGRIVNIFLLFSQAENHVKETVADRMVLKTVLKDLQRMHPQHQITMLKFIKNLSMLATTLDALQNSNAIEVLTDLLKTSMKMPHFREISNQVLNTMYNLCRLSKARQEDAALSGVVPLLQRIVQTERPLKEFALPILCDMAHSGKVGRKILWQNKGLHFYVGLLADQYWAVTALDAIFIWLQEETAKVEEHLLSPSSNFASSIAQCFNESKADAFENLLEPLQKLLRLSPAVAATLAQRSLFERAAVKVHSKKALVRLNLLRVIRSICDACEEQGSLLRQYGLLEPVRELEKHDPAILVRNLAEELVRHSEHATAIVASGARGSSAGRPMNRRSSSSTMMSPSPLLTQSASSTPITSNMGLERVRSRGYFDLALVSGSGAGLSSASRGSSSLMNSPYRPASRDGGSGSSSAGGWSHHRPSASMENINGIAASRSSSRVPPQGIQRPSSRMSLAPALQEETRPSSSRRGSVQPADSDQITPTHMPPPRGGALAVKERKRRQGSSVDLGGR
ncbi:Cytokinesis protein sepH [Fulvia fulva]|uniref:non-specific serine/threonine protein kinase n=1 Tax=Passalora fulva TaxID=5499 RepID=A0A9Q8PLX5_PASFU|nr:Cytokinesis protein sepH [Fulvia fulva]UJO24802.1 Cytokinesis protein sepH [Fulvia fulva]